jgi:hypothetical protein
MDTEFAVFKESADAATGTPFCHFKVTQVDSVSSIGRVIENIMGKDAPPEAYARQTKTGRPLDELHVYVDPNDNFLSDLLDNACQLLRAVDEKEWWMVSRAGQGEAQIGVHVEDTPSPAAKSSAETTRILVFKILDSQICALGINPSRLPFTVPATSDYLAHVLRAASRFFYHLRRSPDMHRLREKVSVHIYELEQTSGVDDDNCSILGPVPNKADIIPPIYNANSPATWRVVADGANTYYGVELVQKSGKIGLFASMVFFDCHNLEVRKCLYAFLDPRH